MNPIIEKIRKVGLVPVIKIDDAAKAVPLAKALAKGGIPVAEVTFRTACAAEAIRNISKECPEVILGAGTVISVEQAKAAVEAGAKYIISPDTNVDVIKKTRELGLVSMPGALTPTEVLQAHRAGADFVKLFPVGNLGASYIKALCAPISHVKMLGVGGVNEDNVAEFLKAGVYGVGVGGNLANKKWIEAGEFDKITATAKKLVENIKNA